VSPDGRSAYVTNTTSGSVSQYDIGAGGLLAPLSPATVAAGVQPFGLAVSPDGGSVYVANSSGDSVSQYDVGAGGALSPKSPATVATGAFTFPISVAVSPDGGSVYVTNVGDDSVSQYDVGPGGALSPKSPATVAAGDQPFGVAVSPDGASVYVANSGNDTAIYSVSQYDVGAGGALSPKSPATVATGVDPRGVAVSPDGGSAYVANFIANVNGGSVSQYDVGAGGALSPKSPATVATGNGPFGVTVTPAQVPTSKEQCKHGGWRNFPQFKNQGQCIAFVNHGP
jgi:DNA-binding beta-propeller fold protein YncE